VLEDIYVERRDQLSGIQTTKDTRIKELTKRRDVLIKRLIRAENENIVKAFEKEIDLIDSEILDLDAYRDDMEGLEAFKLSGIKLLERPKESWLEANYQERKLIYDFVFDKSIEIQDGKIGTAPYALPYRLLSKPIVRKESMVELGGIEPPTSTVPR
tara:strand:+ start:146 stop:616 length:471 start_codon:yes stop_codon:yes gene_type:complete